MRIARFASALAAVLALLLAPTLVSAEHHEAAEANDRKPWDQAAMTDLSAQLARAMREVRRAFRRDPVFADPQSLNRRAAQRMEETLRALEQSTRQLHNRVSSGEGFEETRPIARRIGMLLNDADVEGRRLMTGEWMHQRVRPAMALINEIAPYYGSGPLFDPETMQRLDRPPNPSRGSPPE